MRWEEEVRFWVTEYYIHPEDTLRIIVLDSCFPESMCSQIQGTKITKFSSCISLLNSGIRQLYELLCVAWFNVFSLLPASIWESYIFQKSLQERVTCTHLFFPLVSSFRKYI